MVWRYKRHPMVALLAPPFPLSGGVCGTEEHEAKLDPGIPHVPTDRRLLDDERGEVPELVLLTDQLPVLPHEFPDDLVRGLEDEFLRTAQVAVVRHRGRDLGPDEGSVLRVAEHVRREHALVRDRHVATRA